MAISLYVCGLHAQHWQLFEHPQCSGHACSLSMGLTYLYELIIYTSEIIYTAENAAQDTVHKVFHFLIF